MSGIESLGETGQISADQVMDLTGALPLSAGDTARSEEVQARDLLREYRIVVGPEDSRSVVEIAKARGLLPLVEIEGAEVQK